MPGLIKYTQSALATRFIVWLNQNTHDFVLKGDTSLVLCYGLVRLLEDIDLDAVNLHRDIISYVTKFCCINKLNFSVIKDTNTTKRCLIHYTSVDDKDAILKIDVSYRQQPNPDNITNVKGIMVYKIDCLMLLKLSAFSSRDKVRDLYDILYIYKMYRNFLSPQSIYVLRNELSRKDMLYIEEMIKVQSDPLIDTSALIDLYLNTCISLGVIA